MIKNKYSELKYVPDTIFTREEFEDQKKIFLKKLRKNVDSYFFVTHEKFEIKVFKIFKKEYIHYIDFFLKNKDNLTRIKLIKRNHEIYLRESSNKEEKNAPEISQELRDELRDLEYIDNPQQLWNDLDTRIKNMFIERYIGKHLLDLFSNSKWRGRSSTICSAIEKIYSTRF